MANKLETPTGNIKKLKNEVFTMVKVRRSLIPKFMIIKVQYGLKTYDEVFDFLVKKVKLNYFEKEK